MPEEGRGKTEKASEILRRRGDRTNKLQKVLDRGSPRSQADDAQEAEPVGPSDAAAHPLEEGRSAKPIIEDSISSGCPLSWVAFELCCLFTTPAHPIEGLSQRTIRAES